MKLDPLRLRAWDDAGEEINITLSEWRIILVLWMADRRITLQELCDLLYNGYTNESRMLVRTHVCRIRRKLGSTVITGPQNWGYLWRGEQAAREPSAPPPPPS